jgi:UDP-N-acetylglucosamine 4,6-dehydratase
VVGRLLAGGEYERIVVYSRGEFGQAMMQERLGVQPRLRYMIGDVRDGERLRRALVGVQEVVHGAALKYVAAGVYNVDEIYKTNVLGTMQVIEAAADRGVGRVLVIASDKGVHAANVYGASKFAAEQYAVQANAFTFPQGTRVAVLRSGNALWSRGSVAHRFKAARPPYRITDRRMTRFGITLTAAAELIERLLGVMRGGEIFVPRLPSFRVEDVANAVHHRGFRAADKTPLEVVGLRPGGEKLHESLLAPEESLHTMWVEALGCYVVEPPGRSWDRPAWEGEPVPEGWEYSSDKNPEWLTEADLIRSFGELDPGLPSA